MQETGFSLLLLGLMLGLWSLLLIWFEIRSHLLQRSPWWCGPGVRISILALFLSWAFWSWGVTALFLVLGIWIARQFSIGLVAYSTASDRRSSL